VLLLRYMTWLASKADCWCTTSHRSVETDACFTITKQYNTSRQILCAYRIPVAIRAIYMAASAPSMLVLAHPPPAGLQILAGSVPAARPTGVQSVPSSPQTHGALGFACGQSKCKFVAGDALQPRISEANCFHFMGKCSTVMNI